MSDVSLEKSYRDGHKPIFHTKLGNENGLFYGVNNWGGKNGNKPGNIGISAAYQ